MGQSRNAQLQIFIALVSLVCSRWSAASTVSDWSGASGNWSSDGVPGWNGTGVPNAPAATAQRMGAGPATTTQDIAGGVTVGTIRHGGSTNAYWTITTTNPITLNQDGAGPGFATITNSNSAAGSDTSINSANYLHLTGSAPLELADDLLISNTSGSIYLYGSILLNNQITGTGNLTIHNEMTNWPSGLNVPGTGAINFNSPSANTFVGNTLIQKGLVTFSNGAAFGPASNVITLGESGQGTVMLFANGGNGLPHNIVVAAGTGGTTYLGTRGTVPVTYTGNVTLNGDLTVTSGGNPNNSSGGLATFAGNFSGAGGVSHFGIGSYVPADFRLGGISVLSGTNSYAGPTRVTSGTLAFAKRVSLYNANPSDWTATNLTVQPGTVAAFYVGGPGEFTAADIETLSTVGTATGGFMNGSYMALNVDSVDFNLNSNIGAPGGGANAVGLVKYGTKKLTLSGTNSYTGPTFINSGVVHFAKRSSFYHNLPGSWVEANLSVDQNATALFSVGGADEFTSADMGIVAGFNTGAAGGFDFLSIWGLDTTNAVGGVFTVGANIPGSSRIIEKRGANTLVFSGTNSYGGETRVFDGTLKVSGSHTTTSNRAKYTIAGSSGSTANLVLDGGTLALTTLDPSTFSPGIHVGTSAGNGTFTQVSGSILANAVNVGHGANAVGTYDLLAGTATVGNIGVGTTGGVGTLNNAGSIATSSGITVGTQDGVGTLNNSGTIVGGTSINIGTAGGVGTLNNTGNLSATTDISVSSATAGSNGQLNHIGSGVVNGRDLKVLQNGTVRNASSISLNRNVQFAAGGEYEWQLAALSTSNPGGDFGMLTLAGELILGGTSKLELDFSLVGDNGPTSSHAFWGTNHTWKIIDTATNTGSTNFTTLLNPLFTSGYFTTAVGTGADLGDIFLNFTVSPLHPGDFDADGDVDGADFVTWQTNFPKPSGANVTHGDADGDGDVDGADFVVWQTNFPFTPGPGASPVPEPTALLLGALSAIGFFALRRRK